MSAERPARVSDVNEFLNQVFETAESRPVFDTPGEAVAWLGDVDAIVRGDDAPAKRLLACRLIALGVPAHVIDKDELAEFVLRAGGTAIAEMNAVVATFDNAFVRCDDDLMTLDDVSMAGETMYRVLVAEDEDLIEVAGFHTAGAVLADPRPYEVAETDLDAASQAVDESLAYAEGVALMGDRPSEHLYGIVICSRNIVVPTPEASVAPEADTDLHYFWGRIAGHAVELISCDPFSPLDPPFSVETQLEHAIKEAALVLAASPMLRAPILFDHARAAGNVGFCAHGMTSSWLSRALGYFDEEETDGVIRTVQDLRAQRALLAQALIGVFCSAG